jgi:hypothetical protein
MQTVNYFKLANLKAMLGSFYVNVSISWNADYARYSK